MNDPEMAKSFWNHMPGVKAAQAELDAFHSALGKQVGGQHYKDQAIQPVEYIHANGLSFLAGNVVKYISRYSKKGEAIDVEKAKHYCELILELEYGNVKAD